MKNSMLTWMLLPFLGLLGLMGCEQKPANMPPKPPLFLAKGELFIIGGGPRPVPLFQRMLKEAEVTPQDYVIVLPLSSEEPDSSFFYIKKDFVREGINDVRNYYFPKGKDLTPAQYDTLKQAKLIFFTGGDQNKFMSIIEGTNVKNALREAYQNGTMLAGTSAGAAVMSEKMITGNELKHKDYRETFENIEADNIEIGTGLGVVTTIIVDQHFLKRSRHNRLLTAVIEHPHLKSVGIDEATAILVKGGKTAEVVGANQVLVFENPKASKVLNGDKLGARNILVSIYTAGETFSLE
ncbi:MAG: cyanophycinase [Flammeovirgaceae bacterium]|nr:cyanophycinase [Flammeovirgaceae bacterium]MDW8287999.1 cyanophycinase [Flammeovirgaceae bacterium]